MPRPRRRRYAIRAAVRGGILRGIVRGTELAARFFPQRFPMVDQFTGKSALLDSTRLGRFELVGRGLGLVHAFANVGVIIGRRAAIVVDTSTPAFAPTVLSAIRAHCELPWRAIIYTHGHLDHVTGVEAFLEDCRNRDEPRPEIWGHERILNRLDRYERTAGWIGHVNQRQFARRFKSEDRSRTYIRPDHTYRESATLDLDGEAIELHHASAETDDATWVWLPERQAAFVGDLLLSSLPNTGNPNKPQRDTLGWAEALERIAARGPRVLLPGHTAAIQGDECDEVLRETARALRYLHDAVVDRLNAGLWPDEIIGARLQLPDDLRHKPFLRESYGCCDFIVRDVLRQYAGWWGGNPAELTPTSRSERAADWLAVVDRDRLTAKILELRAAKAPRRALPFAVALADSPNAGPADRELLAAVLDEIASEEPSFIARSLYQQEAVHARRPPEDRPRFAPTTGTVSTETNAQPSTSRAEQRPNHTASQTGSHHSAVRPDRAPVMSLINFVGRGAWAIGLKRPLSAEGIVRAARRGTKLQDFGDPRFVDALDRLCDALNRSARLEPFGMLLVRQSLVRYAVNRLKIEDWFQRHPEIAARPIVKPLFVIGLPRTGTTLLYNLLAQDPRARPLMTWETLYPGPDPFRHGGTSDPRRTLARRGVRFMERIAPRLKHIHEFSADGPEECTWLLNNTFTTPGFALDADLPDYLAWILSRTDEQLLPAYEDYRRQLQLIDWGGPTDRHWLTKSPLHLNGIGAMLRVFPDGAFVQTHRDPRAVVPSTCSLVAVMRGRATRTIDAQRLGAELSRLLASGLNKTLAARAEAPERIFDIRYPDLIKNPLGTVERLYDHFGYELTPAMTRNMERWLSEHPANKHGTHKYALEDFGLTERGIEELFGDYARQVGVANA